MSISTRDLKGYTVYLTKQAAKALNTPSISVNSDKKPYFDTAREVYVITKGVWEAKSDYVLSKEAVLLIEYRYGDPYYIDEYGRRIGEQTTYWKSDKSITLPTAMYSQESTVEVTPNSIKTTVVKH